MSVFLYTEFNEARVINYDMILADGVGWFLGVGTFMVRQQQWTSIVRLVESGSIVFVLNTRFVGTFD